MNIFKNKSFLALSVFLILGACSKKQAKEEGDAAGDSAAAANEMGANGAGQAIPELATIYFGYDSFSLDGSAKAALKANADWLKSNSGRSVQVEGHCDERGTEEYNLALGERRAAAVKDHLVSLGVPASQVSTISYGEERPAVQGGDESAWSKNRRASFVSAGN